MIEFSVYLYWFILLVILLILVIFFSPFSLMMILPLSSFIFFFFFLKEFIFLGCEFFLDRSLRLMIFIFPLVLFLINLTSFNFVDLKDFFLYFLIFSLVTLFLSVSFSSITPLFFLIFLENCVILIFSLIFWFSKDLDKISSALFMFLINIFPSIFFMCFCFKWGTRKIFLDYFLFQSLDFFYLFCFLGLLVSKLPLFFFHFWLTKAHVRASGSGSIILASLLLKIGSIGLYKFYSIFLKNFKFFRSFFFSLVVIRRVFLLLIILRFFDLKYLVACSSIIHIAPIFPLCIWGAPRGIFRCILIIVGHGLISYFVFFLVRVLYEIRYNRSIDFNKSLSSLSKRAIIFFFFFFLMNLGFPPFARFIRELIFFLSFFNYSFFISFIFFLGLILRGLVFFFFISKRLFGKKLISNIFFFNTNIILYSLIYFFFFFLLPLIYFYSFSLIKISFCGSEDLKSIDIFQNFFFYFFSFFCNIFMVF